MLLLLLLATLMESIRIHPHGWQGDLRTGKYIYVIKATPSGVG